MQHTRHGPDRGSKRGRIRHLENEAARNPERGHILGKSLARLAHRLLREPGFIQLNVDGRTEDGSIEGNGTLRLNPRVSAKVFLKVKHTLEPVTKSQVRDFHGPMLGRGNHGLIITTGSFTTSAIEEAIRDGVPLIGFNTEFGKICTLRLLARLPHIF